MAALPVVSSVPWSSRIKIGTSALTAEIRCVLNRLAISGQGQYDSDIRLEPLSRHRSTHSTIPAEGREPEISTTSGDINDLPDGISSTRNTHQPTTMYKIFTRVVSFLRYLCLGFPQQYSAKAHVVIRNMDADGTALVEFAKSWEDFVKSMSRNWNRSWNISTFLFTASMTVALYQGAHPFPRVCAILPLSCAFVGLLTASFLLHHFDNHASQNVDQALRWLKAARESDPLSAYHTWVVLAMPEVWTTWGIICFLVLAVSCIWVMGMDSDSSLHSSIDSGSTPHNPMDSGSTSHSPMDVVQFNLGMAIGVILVLAIVEVGLVWRALKRFAWDFWRHNP